jgi:hypothetical protein
MTEVAVVYFERDARELVSINSADVLRSSFPLSTCPRSGAAPFGDGREPPDLRRGLGAAESFYRLARHALDALYAGAPADLVSTYFDVWILRLSGLFPNPAECAGLRPPSRAVLAFSFWTRPVPVSSVRSAGAARCSGSPRAPGPPSSGS